MATTPGEDTPAVDLPAPAPVVTDDLPGVTRPMPEDASKLGYTTRTFAGKVKHYKCEACRYSTSDKRAIEIHVRVNHPNRAGVTSSPTPQLLKKGGIIAPQTDSDGNVTGFEEVKNATK